MNINELIESIHNALFRWYDIPADADVYVFDKETVALQDGKKYDYIISKVDIETYKDPSEFLQLCKLLLKEDGHLLLAVHNRFGLKNFCGDKDLYTKRCFDGIEDYVNAYVEDGNSFQGRTYAKSQLQKLLKEAGFFKYRFFSVLSDLENPVLIYREDFLPNEDLMIRIFPTYHHPDTVFLDEKMLYKGLIENDMFHQMANAYIIECALDEDAVLSDVQHVTSSIERGKDSAIITTIHDSGVVEKCAVYKEGHKRIQKLYEYGENLRTHGVKMVPAKYENDRYQMPFINLENGLVYLKRLRQENTEAFLEALDLFCDTVLKSSKIIKEDIGDGEGAILEYAYLDMVPLNSFFDGKEFVFYDQEFRREAYPANVILFRTVAGLYCGEQVERQLSIPELFKRYHLDEKLEKWQQLEKEFLVELRNEELLEEYHNKVRANGYSIYCNRNRMERSARNDQMIYQNIFHNLDKKKLILFGSGVYAERFWKYYGKKYPAYAVVDNQELKWNTSWHKVLVHEPDWLLGLEKDSYKLIICVANFEPIIKQLEQMGITEYGVFDIQRLFGNLEIL